MITPEVTSFDATDNLNILRNSNFQLIIQHMKFVNFFAQDVDLPDLSVENIEQKRSVGRGFELQGNHLSYTPLTISYMLDEDFKNYDALVSWLKATVNADPDEINSFESLVIKNTPYNIDVSNAPILNNVGKEASLLFPRNNHIHNIEMVFQNLFPISISSPKLSVNIEDTPVYLINATFKFDTFKLVKIT